ncbi:hypothetical protein RJP21_13795 [Paenibacillus sp. VCA1]|uniref:hypothetical protein n=1 Tax=Paenibacillus sp. VCA1 TaxID=3039148 RepID=UPI0028728164|nr:hypothetical protein [Paenibacillus sp. VCA1]MDR9854683.1 hypothetical protein [Paenibacillus sp. VCA1]
MNKGKKIALTLIGSNLLLVLLVEILRLAQGIFTNLLGTAVWIVTMILIYCGVKKAKWAFVIFTVWNIAMLIAAWAGKAVISPLPMNLWIFATAAFLLQIATSVVFVFSSSVSDFLYKQGH